MTRSASSFFSSQNKRSPLNRPEPISLSGGGKPGQTGAGLGSTVAGGITFGVDPGATSGGGEISVLAGLLERQSELYQQLDALSQQQSRQITEGSVQDLLGVLSQRQCLIDELTQIEQDLVPYRRDWERVCAAMSDEVRRRIEPLLDQTREALSRIIEQDEKDRQLLEQARGQIGSQLSDITHTGAAMRAYKGQGPGENRFTNKRG